MSGSRCDGICHCGRGVAQVCCNASWIATSPSYSSAGEPIGCRTRRRMRWSSGRGNGSTRSSGTGRALVLTGTPSLPGIALNRPFSPGFGRLRPIGCRLQGFGYRVEAGDGFVEGFRWGHHGGGFGVVGFVVAADVGGCPWTASSSEVMVASSVVRRSAILVKDSARLASSVCGASSWAQYRAR